MKLCLLTFFFTLFLLFPFNSLAQETPLQPGEVHFNIPPIIVNRSEINLTANATHLSIYYEAYYLDMSQNEIGVICFLNCDKGYEVCSGQAQNCSVLSKPGKGVCSILNPKFTSLTSSNNVSCTFYHPVYLEYTRGVAYLNATFVPIEFSIWASNYSSIVGEEFNLLLYIKNSGLFPDSYSVTMFTDPTKIFIGTKNFTTPELHGDSFDPEIWQQTGPETESYSIKLIVLNANPDPTPKICINVDSLQMLNYGGLTKQVCVEIKSQFKSVPELDLAQILLIMLLATIFIFKFKKKFKGL
jgi:hypothetical protein